MEGHYEPTDLLDIKNAQSKNNMGLTAIDKIIAACKDSYEALNFSSNAIEDFFFEISCVHTKRRFRVTVRFLLLYACSVVMLSPIVYPGDLNKLILSVAYNASTIIIYFFTFKKLSYYGYNLLSSATVVITIFFYLVYSMDRKSTSEVGYAPMVHFILLMLGILPIPLELSSSVAILYSISFETMVYSRLYYGINDISKSIRTYDKNVSLFQRVGHVQFNRKDLNNSKYIWGQSVLLVACLFLGIYLHISNQLRRRASFLRLGENVKAQVKVKTAYQDQMKCISAIMPSEIKDSYWTERKEHGQEEMWVYTKCYDNVTILFADIVGFTNMSSNKTAPQVVTLLNDLFNRFDQMCKLTSCEKLGTLGDCYYCVAGCPTPRSDHATCCIEMGLGMCRIILAFNIDYNESVNMRVGVHTGRVNAAIIGNQRFRFDVYSNDVIVSNEIESSGLPGRVHISEPTYQLTHNLYQFEEGSDLEIKKEVQLGIQGMKLTTISIKTHFVLPESAKLLGRTKQIEEGNKIKFQIVTKKKKNKKKKKEKNDEPLVYDEKHIDNELVYDEQGGNDEDMAEKYEDNMDGFKLFIDALRKDPDRQIKLFENPPIWPLNLKFLDSEIEQHYYSHTRDEIRPMYVDSVKLAPLIDCFACLVYTSLIMMSSYFFAQKFFLERCAFVVFLFIVGFINTIIVGWSTMSIEPFIKTDVKKKIFFFFSHHITRNIQANMMCFMPVIMCAIMFDCQQFYKNHIYTSAMFSLSLFSIFGFSIYVSAAAWINISSAFIVTCMCITFFCVDFFKCIPFERCRPGSDASWCTNYTCESLQTVYFENDWLRYVMPLISSYILSFYVVVRMNRENESNLRLCFYVSREVQIRCEEADQIMKASVELLHNIIPKYALDQIIARGGDIAKGDFSYAVNIKNAGVIFACISNFFSKYYREDYKGGEGALRMLNKVMCMFDDELKEDMYSDVEKIKTINDCYMVASGLNYEQVQRNKDSKRHLRALLSYCFAMQRNLKLFNEEYVFGKDKFEMKIGYNIGPVTAGVIGTTKPMYDIWGDTVNVSSRMYSTGLPGLVQVPLKVKNILLNHFKFTFKGIVQVKGKGEMETYIAEEKVMHPGRQF